MPVLSKEERAAFLAERGVVMHIAVIRPGGAPLVTPVWYLYEDEAVYFTPRERSEWFACLRDDPRVALAIDEQPLPYRKVIIEGAAALLHDIGADARWRDLYLRMAARYVPAEAARDYLRDTIDERRGLYRVVLAEAKVRSWRMPLKGEAGEGIWHASYYNDPDIHFGERA